MSRVRIIILTLLAMLAFAGNSLLCRVALKLTHIDAVGFTTIRLISGAVILSLIVLVGRGHRSGAGNWLSAAVLFVYAYCFSFAYVSLSAGTGALILFATVQATMIGWGMLSGERFRILQIIGLALAIGGLIGLVLPGLSAPPLFGSALMLVAGVGWGAYSLRGKSVGDPTRVNAGNFLRALPMAVALTLLMHDNLTWDAAGFWYAVAAGALTTGIGYVIWYTALPSLKASTAATIQLSVPVIAALGGILFLGEFVTMRLVIASIAILGGIALVIVHKQQQ